LGDTVRAAEALKQGIIYCPSYLDLDSIGLKWKDLDCLNPGGWLTDKVMGFYTKYLERGEDITLGKSRKELLEQFMFVNTFVYTKLRTGNEKEVREFFFIVFLFENPN
jgi:Ulp1 family protease